MNFQPGNVVMIKSGGPWATILSIDDENVTLAYFDEVERQVMHCKILVTHFPTLFKRIAR